MSGNLSKLSREELELACEVFLATDTDGDGHVTRSEVEVSMSANLHNMQELFGSHSKNHYLEFRDGLLDFYLSYLDLNDDGNIEFTEFVLMYSHLQDKDTGNKEGMTQMFKALDKNKDGTISYSEWVLFCKLFNSCDSIKGVDNALRFQRTVSTKFDLIDDNNDGRIDYNEFLENYDIF